MHLHPASSADVSLCPHRHICPPCSRPALWRLLTLPPSLATATILSCDPPLNRIPSVNPFPIHHYDELTDYLCTAAAPPPPPSIAQAPNDAIFGVKDAFVKDADPNKVNLSIGAYRDDDGKPLVLPSIDIAERRIIERRPNMEYAPIAGIPEFNELTLKVVYGWESAAIEEERIAVVSTLSGTGSLRVCGEFVDKFLPRLAPEATVYLPDVTWGNHKGIFAAAGLGVKSYTYYDPKTCGFDFAGMCADLTAMPDGSAVLLHSVGHNPTGVDPTKEQWRALSDICLAKRHFPIFDTAYQGFATGDAEADAFSVRLFVEEGHSLACCQSYAKNMGMYGQRCGALSVVCPDADEAKRVKSHLSKIVRTMWSSPPLHGSRIAAEVLKDTELRAMWYGEMKMMSSRISDMRTALRNRLLELGSKEPNAWRHLVDQVGMFCFTGLTAEQVGGMRSKHHIYMLSNGRISVAGVNTKNVNYIANAMHDVTKDGWAAKARL